MKSSSLILASAVALVVANSAFAAITLPCGDVQQEASGTAGITVGNNPVSDYPTTSAPVVTAILAQPGVFKATLKGGATVSKTYSNWSFLINDGSGSLDVFGKMPTGNTYIPTVGDAVTATGSYIPYNGIPELGTLTAITKNSSGNSVPAPLSLTAAALHSSSVLTGAVDENGAYTILGQLITLHNVYIGGLTVGQFSTSNLTCRIYDTQASAIANSTTTPTSNIPTAADGVTMYYWESSYSSAFINLAGSYTPQATDGAFNVTGFVDVFSPTQPEFIPIAITAADGSPLSTVPEPASLGILGLGAVALLRRRK